MPKAGRRIRRSLLKGCDIVLDWQRFRTKIPTGCLSGGTGRSAAARRQRTRGIRREVPGQLKDLNQPRQRNRALTATGGRLRATRSSGGVHGHLSAGEASGDQRSLGECAPVTPAFSAWGSLGPYSCSGWKRAGGRIPAAEKALRTLRFTSGSNAFSCRASST